MEKGLESAFMARLVKNHQSTLGVPLIMEAHQEKIESAGEFIECEDHRIFIGIGGPMHHDGEQSTSFMRIGNKSGHAIENIQ